MSACVNVSERVCVCVCARVRVCVRALCVVVCRVCSVRNQYRSHFLVVQKLCVGAKVQRSRGQLNMLR